MAVPSNVPGSLIFGIGTQSNNGLGSATVYDVPSSGTNAGDFTTIFNGTSYPASFIDSGSNGLFFLNSKRVGCACDVQRSDHVVVLPISSPDNLSAATRVQT